MTKVKVSEAEGEALNWMVAKANGDEREFELAQKYPDDEDDYSPSTDWERGGPIIERERLQLSPNAHGTDWGCNRWAVDKSGADRPNQKRGPTPLIAAMRCYVASKLGDEVDVPEELT